MPNVEHLRKNIRNKKLTIKSFLEGNLVEEKPNSFISLLTPFQSDILNKDQIFTAVNDILLRAQACIKSDGVQTEIFQEKT